MNTKALHSSMSEVLELWLSTKEALIMLGTPVQLPIRRSSKRGEF
jgi:hypothetical protein